MAISTKLGLLPGNAPRPVPPPSTACLRCIPRNSLGTEGLSGPTSTMYHNPSADTGRRPEAPLYPAKQEYPRAERAECMRHDDRRPEVLRSKG